MVVNMYVCLILLHDKTTGLIWRKFGIEIDVWNNTKANFYPPNNIGIKVHGNISGIIFDLRAGEVAVRS